MQRPTAMYFNDTHVQHNEEGLWHEVYPEQALHTCVCINLMWERSFPGFDTPSHVKLRHASIKCACMCIKWSIIYTLHIVYPYSGVTANFKPVLCMESNRFRHTHIHAKADWSVHMYYKFVFLHQYLYSVLFQHPQTDRLCTHIFPSACNCLQVMYTWYFLLYSLINSKFSTRTHALTHRLQKGEEQLTENKCKLITSIYRYMHLPNIMVDIWYTNDICVTFQCLMIINLSSKGQFTKGPIA